MTRSRHQCGQVRGNPNGGKSRDALRQKFAATDRFIHFGGSLMRLSDCKLRCMERQAILDQSNFASSQSTSQIDLF
jgi:hypothetical protein